MMKNCMIKIIWAVWPWSMVYFQTKRFNSSNGCYHQWNIKTPECRVFTSGLLNIPQMCIRDRTPTQNKQQRKTENNKFITLKQAYQ